MCPGRTCASQQQSQSLPQQIKDYAEHLGHQLMCKIDPVASAQFGGLPIMYRGPLQSSSKEVAEVASFLLFKEWTQAFEATMKATTSTGKAWMLQNPISNISDMTQLDNLYNYFMNHYTIHNEVSTSTANTATSTTEDVVASDDLPEGFWERDNITDPFLSINQRWNDDNIFAQSRLMATNPLQIQRVTSSSESDSDIGMNWKRLFPLLNKRDFDWEAEVRNVVGMSIKQVQQCIVYAVWRSTVFSCCLRGSVLTTSTPCEAYDNEVAALNAWWKGMRNLCHKQIKLGSVRVTQTACVRRISYTLQCFE